MDSVTFKMRQQYLNEFYSKDRVDFLSALKYIVVDNYHFQNISSNNIFSIDTTAVFEKSNINSRLPFESYLKFLNPFLYFLYSFTRKEKFLKGSILKLNYLYISCLNNREQVSNVLLYPKYEGFNLLNKINLYDFIDRFKKEINKIYI